ncbi:MAG: oxidoreductase family protein [Candidatus Sericytochromatia bacterium]
MHQNISDFILNKTNSTLILKKELIQLLWGGYGELLKVTLNNEEIRTAIIKYIVLPKHNNSISHQRKVKSYQIEINWYMYWANFTNDLCRIPKCLGVMQEENIFVIILEDLDNSGYPLRKRNLTINEAKLCLSWLANFHANFLFIEPKYLWEIGTYWHLDTRPDELLIMNDMELKKFSKIIDTKLNACKYKTFVHGDSKLANFCFSNDINNVSMVDFQYVGGGCGMKDIAYFFDSALSEEQCKNWEKKLIDYYFQELKKAINLFNEFKTSYGLSSPQEEWIGSSEVLSNKNKNIDFDELESEWRNLYPLCWADFYRFLSGWMPNHKYYNSYNINIIKKALADLV